MADILRELDAEADAEYELESEEGSLFTGTVLLIGAMTMAWAGVAFAYFYLREIDTATLFRAGHRPPVLLGDLIGLVILVGAILYSWGVNRLRSGMAFEFQLAAWLAVGCGCVATSLQAWQLTRLGFAPGVTGYTSVFVGYAILNVGFLFYGAFWTETVAARALRLRGMYPPETYIGVSVHPQARLWRASVRGCLLFWWFMVAATVFFWILFYVL